MLTKEQKEYLTTIGLTTVESFKVFMGCLLSVFVPQYCEDTNTTCTMNQNFSDLSNFNAFVLSWNFLALVSFIVLYKAQIQRETYFIKHLEENPSKPENSLQSNLQEYPKISTRVQDHNRELYKYSTWCIMIYLINVVLSCVLVFYYFYDGFRSVTSMITSVLLVANRLYTSYDVSLTCISSDKLAAVSSTLVDPVIYNDIDSKYQGQQHVEAKVEAHVEKHQLEPQVDPQVENQSSSPTQEVEIELQPTMSTQVADIAIDTSKQ